MNQDKTTLLDAVRAPGDLKKLNTSQLMQLCSEIRQRLLEVISRCGGHLGANLGTVELTVALLRSFDVPDEPVIWDVGHQCYTWKLLTGRQKEFDTLRTFGGSCGFPVRGTSKYDCYSAGHAGIAISAGLGMCAAEPRDSRKKIVAVVGDGALNSGVALEGLNQAHEHGRNLVIILNDNKMAIAPNVGAIASCLNRVIIGRRYRHFKNLTKRIVNALPRAESLTRRVQTIENAAKSILLPGGLFEELGIRYLGPVNGHNIADMERTFKAVRDDDRPVLIHVITEKGHGYAPAVAAPEHFHGVSSFEPDSGTPLSPGRPGFSAAFGEAMLEVAPRHPEMCAVVAAMAGGVGLHSFAEQYPERFYDEGIAEGHAVSFASGLAAAGKHPVVAIYATFFQRALDNLFHDVCLMKLPVVFALDRAGVVEDGPTHHGIHDLGFLLSLPNLTILAPGCEAEVAPMLEFALNSSAPAVIRYPRGCSHAENFAIPLTQIVSGQAAVWKEGNSLAIYAVGAEAVRAMKIAEILKQDHALDAKVVNVRFLKPFDETLFLSDLAKMPVFTLEDHVVSTGLGAIAALSSQKIASPHRVISFGYPDNVTLPFGRVSKIREAFELDEENLARKIAASLKH